MAHLDRLSNLIAHFEIRAEKTVTVEESNLVLSRNSDGLSKLTLYLDGRPNACAGTQIAAHAKVDLGGQDNPLFEALPDVIHVDLTQEPDVHRIAELIVIETANQRCGGSFALNCLCELLVVHLLRHHIEKEGAETGVFAGLAHAHLSRVLVAIHDNPGRQWQLDDFLQIAGMSRSQFMVVFQSVIGRTPIAYLKHWRMTLARSAVCKGERIKEIARRYGYGSGDAFCRAFVKEFGVSPTKMASELKRAG